MTTGVFLDYASDDEAAARGLDSRLRGLGLRTAVDRDRRTENDIPAEPVLQDLGACDALVLLWSAAAAADHRIGVILRTAASFGKDLLAVPVDGTAPPPDASRTATAAEVLAAVGARPQRVDTADIILAPGDWTVETGADDTYVLSLGEDGQVRGERRTRGLTGTVTGDWTYDHSSARLTLDLAVTIGLRPQRSLLDIQLLGSGDARLTGVDVHGLAAPARYTLRRT